MSSQPWRLGKLQRRRTDGSKYWSYCIKWDRSDGTRRRVSLGTTDEQAAGTLARELWARLNFTSADTVGEIVEAYLGTLITKADYAKLSLDDRVNRAAALKDAKRKRESWLAAGPYWSGLTMQQIDNTTSTAYLAWRGKAANTVRNELGLVRVALKWGAEPARAMIDKAPKIILPSMPPSKVSHLTKAEFRLFLAGCRAPHMMLFCQLAVTTGARVTALLELRWDQVDFVRRLVNLKPSGRTQKANKQRAIVPLNDRIVPLLHAAYEGRTSEYVIEHGGDRILTVKTGMRLASARSGVRCTPHMLRHSAAVWMAEDRTPMTEIAAYLGHTDTRITERVYARFSPDYLRRASLALDW